MDIKKELKNNQIIMVVEPAEKYSQTVVDIARALSKKSLCYVTLNKTFDSLKEEFKKKKVNTENIIFIDAISKTIKQVPQQTDSCYYVSSPGSLTEISIAIDRFLRHNFEYLVFDSLTNMLIYEKKAPVAKFISSIVNKIKQSKTKAVFYALKIKEQNEIIEEAEMFVDKIINI